MLKKSTISWTAKALVGKIKRGEVVFDNAVQRGYVWDKKRKSLFIHSMLEEFPVPHFYAAKNEDKGYDCLDGKQRSNTIRSFFNNEFALYSNTPETTLEDGEVYELVGKKYEDLPEELQDRLNDFLLNIYYFEDITDDEIASLFFRINNGKPMSGVDLTRVKALSRTQINEIGKHEIFKHALTAKELEGNASDDITMKSWVMLNVESPSLSNNDVGLLMEKTYITDEQILELYDCYERLIQVCEHINECGDKVSVKLVKSILKKTHFISLIPIIKKSLSDNISAEAFTEWVQLFFSGEKSASISSEYNEACKSQTSNRAVVLKRHTAILEHYNNHFKAVAAQAV